MSCIWVDEFDFDLGELLALSRSIGRQVASAVGVKLIEIAEARIDRGDLSARLIRERRAQPDAPRSVGSGLSQEHP